MAQTPSLRPEEAYAAIEALLAAGVPPTHLAVREHVGGRGSHPVISRYISEWYSENGPTFAAKVLATRQHNPVADVAAQMLQAGVDAAKIVSDAHRERGEALDRREEQLQEAQQAMEMRERSLLEQSEKLADREASLERLIAELRADKASLSDQLHQTQSQVGMLNAELHRAHEGHAANGLEADATRDKLLAQVASLEVRVADLAAREQFARQAADVAREAEQKALAALSAWNESEHVRRQQAAEALERAVHQNTQLTTSFRADLERVMAESSGREQAQAAELQAALRELSSAKEKVVGLESHVEVLATVKAQLAAVQDERDKAQAAVLDLVASLKQLTKQHAGSRAAE